MLTGSELAAVALLLLEEDGRPETLPDSPSGGGVVAYLHSADDFVVLSKSGITDTGSHSSVIVGNIGASPITGAAIGVYCSEMTGTIYEVDSAYVGSGDTSCARGTLAVDKRKVDRAVADMESAYTTVAGLPNPDATELGGGSIGGMAFIPGIYKWSTDVNIATNITLVGGANDIFVFQIAGNLTIASGGSVPAGTKVLLLGGVQADNVFWQVGGGTGATLGTYSTFNGNILSLTQVIIQTGAVLNGRALAQTQVTLDAAVVNVGPPGTTTSTSSSTTTTTTTTSSSTTTTTTHSTSSSTTTT